MPSFKDLDPPLEEAALNRAREKWEAAAPHGLMLPPLLTIPQNSITTDFVAYIMKAGAKQLKDDIMNLSATKKLGMPDEYHKRVANVSLWEKTLDFAYKGKFIKYNNRAEVPIRKQLIFAVGLIKVLHIKIEEYHRWFPYVFDILIDGIAIADPELAKYMPSFSPVNKTDLELIEMYSALFDAQEAMAKLQVSNSGTSGSVPKQGSTAGGGTLRNFVMSRMPGGASLDGGGKDEPVYTSFYNEKLIDDYWRQLALEASPVSVPGSAHATPATSLFTAFTAARSSQSVTTGASLPVLHTGRSVRPGEPTLFSSGPPPARTPLFPPLFTAPQESVVAGERSFGSLTRVDVPMTSRSMSASRAQGRETSGRKEGGEAAASARGGTPRLAPENPSAAVRRAVSTGNLAEAAHTHGHLPTMARPATRVVGDKSGSNVHAPSATLAPLVLNPGIPASLNVSGAWTHAHKRDASRPLQPSGRAKSPRRDKEDRPPSSRLAETSGRTSFDEKTPHSTAHLNIEWPTGASEIISTETVRADSARGGLGSSHMRSFAEVTAGVKVEDTRDG